MTLGLTALGLKQLGFPLVGKSGGASYYSQLVDPTKPLPSFIEGWALNSLAGLFMAAPAVSGIPLDSMSQLDLEYTVSGSAGASSLTISAGDQSKGTGAWAGVIQHDDLTWGFYQITSLASGVCTVFPNLRAVVTGGTLRNIGGTALGQHWSDPAYRALARRIFNATFHDAYRNRYVEKWKARTGAKLDWTATGGLASPSYNVTTANNYIAYGSVRSTAAFVSRGRTYIFAQPTAPFTGKGLTKTFSLKGNSGTLEAFVSGAAIANTAFGGFYPIKVVASVDGVEFFNQTFTENDGLIRILADFPAGNTGVLTVTVPSETWTTTTSLIIGDVTWWVYDRAEPAPGKVWTDKAFDINAVTVISGDSWTTYYPGTVGGADGILGRELQAAITAAGGTGTVTSVGLGGTTAEYSLAQFDTQVAPLNPTQTILLDFTNDHNQYGDTGWQRWLDAEYAYGVKSQNIGARPIFITPLPTSSLGQALGHGIWSEEIGAGIAL